MNEPKRRTWRELLNDLGDELRSAVILALVVGFVLQNAGSATSVRDDAFQLINRADYAARTGWDPLTNWSISRRATFNQNLDALAFDLKDRIADDIHHCIKELVGVAKFAPSETVTDAIVRMSRYDSRVLKLRKAVETWQNWETFAFGLHQPDMEGCSS